MATDVTPDRLAGAWNYRAVHSSAGFSIPYLVASFSGQFAEVEASLVDGKLSGEVNVASIIVKDENLAAHLQSPDFFDAEQFPTISFASDTLAIAGDDVTLDGQLTMKGVTKPVRATGKIQGPTDDFMGNTRLGFTLTATIDRTDYGVSWNAELPSGGSALGNEVTLNIELEFVKAA